MSPALAPESIRSAACALEGAPVVVGVSVHEPEAGPRPSWTIEATIVDDDGLPASVLRLLAEHDLSVPDVSPRGSGYRLVAIA